MNTWTWPGDLINRMTSAYLSLREAARGRVDRGISRHDEGQGMVEYALILVLIGVVVVLVLSTVGKQVKNIFSNVSSGLGS